MMMKFKDSKLCFKLLNNYKIDFGSPNIEIDNLFALEEFYAYTRSYKKLKDGYYPNRIILVGYPKDESPFYLVFKKIGVTNNEQKD